MRRRPVNLLAGYGMLVALIGCALWLVPVPSAASCKYCKSIGGIESGANTTSSGYTRCVSDFGYCSLSGAQCAYAEADPPNELLSGDEALSVSDRDPAGGPVDHAVELVEIRASAARNAAQGEFPPGAGRDFLLLHAMEPRDVSWADFTELQIKEALSTLDFAALGLSAPMVNCATSICEIGVLQSRQGADHDATNWQIQFIKLTTRGAWKEGLADTAVFSTQAQSGQVAYFSYLYVDRLAPAGQ